MHLNLEKFEFDEEWLREATRIEQEADCDIQAGFGWEKSNTMLFTYVLIKPCASGFKKYEADHSDKTVWHDSDIVNACEIALSAFDGKLYELGVDAIPEEIEDIRGEIHNEPDRVLVQHIPGRTPYYFGLNKRP